MIFVHDLGIHAEAEAVHDDIHHVIGTQKLHVAFRSVIHGKDLTVIIGFPVPLRASHGPLRSHRNVIDAVHPERHDLFVGVRPPDHIVVVPVPEHGVGRKTVCLPVMSEDFFLLLVVVHIAECHFSVPVDGMLKLIDDE